MDVVGVYSILVILTVIGVLLNSAVKITSRKLVFWGNAEEPGGL
jgi:ABC-type nitrate/sulfonate/bicarbonate transport system permease component